MSLPSSDLQQLAMDAAEESKGKSKKIHPSNHHDLPLKKSRFSFKSVYLWILLIVALIAVRPFEWLPSFMDFLLPSRVSQRAYDDLFAVLENAQSVVEEYSRQNSRLPEVLPDASLNAVVSYWTDGNRYTLSAAHEKEVFRLEGP